MASDARTPDAACLHRSLACTYCGRRTDEPDPVDRWTRWPARIRQLACWRHRALTLNDPHYT